MSADVNRCYELLGMKPGASASELKAAYRDLAKVWHPDRFGHDERLQKKAQDKLKEINQAYEQLISGKIPRPQPGPTHRAQRSYTPPGASDSDPSRSTYAPVTRAESSRAIPWRWIVVPLLIFGAVFFLISRSLPRQREQPATDSTEQQTATRDSEVGQPVSAPNQNASERNKSRSEVESNSEAKQPEASVTQPLAAPVQPMATVAVLIDPSTGLLARAECPTKTRMTYPVGNEPHGYCNAAHGKTQSQADGSQSNDSRVKTFAKRVVSPGKWLGGGTKEKSEQ